VKSDCAKTVSPADNALWKFMVNRGRDLFPKIEHVAIGRKRSDRSSARPACDKRFPDRRCIRGHSSVCKKLYAKRQSQEAVGSEVDAACDFGVLRRVANDNLRLG